jgi:hypothetical protein
MFRHKGTKPSLKDASSPGIRILRHPIPLEQKQVDAPSAPTAIDVKIASHQGSTVARDYMQVKQGMCVNKRLTSP